MGWICWFLEGEFCGGCGKWVGGPGAALATNQICQTKPNASVSNPKKNGAQKPLN